MNIDSIRDYLQLSSKDKSFWARSLTLVWTLLVLNYLFKNQEVPGLYNPFWVVSHGIHEIGHWVTRPFGMWVSVASGSIFQFFFPFIFVIAMTRSRDIHGAFVLLTWQVASLLQMAHYAGSAEYSDLVLDSPHYITLYHDWVWMLSQLNATQWARTIEAVFYYSAWGFGFISALGQMFCLKVIWSVNHQS